MPHRHHRSAFSLLEIFVVLGIIAMFLLLLIPFALRMREGSRADQCVRNLQRIGKGILAYTNDNADRLPGPLATAQHPAESAGNPARADQMLSFLARYLDAPKNSPDGPATAKDTFTCPTWQRADRATDAPVFILNTDNVQPHGQPAWGTVGNQPLTLDQVRAWRRPVAGRDEAVDLAKMWALADVDQGVTRILNIKDPWALGTPAKPVHLDRRNALYFDWHVEALTLHRTYLSPAAAEALSKEEQ